MVTNHKHIPLHQLPKHNHLGIFIEKFDIDISEFTEQHYTKFFTAHRDNYFVFFLQIAGDATLMVDFQQIHLSGNIISYILPGQIHYGTQIKNSKGWFIAIESALIEGHYQAVLEESLSINLPCTLFDYQNEILNSFLELLSLTRMHVEDPLAGRALIHSFIGYFTKFYTENTWMQQALTNRRAVQLSRAFKSLLRKNVRTIKSPKLYADHLHVSYAYLKECVKSTTGFSISYWIQQEILIEAQRLLFYSQLSIKEIASELGYEDFSYFSRLFQKLSGETPTQFRKKHHD